MACTWNPTINPSRELIVVLGEKIYLLLSSNVPFERSMIAIHLLLAERTVDDLVKEEERGHHGDRGENSTHLAAINLLQLLWLGTPIF